MIKKIWVGLGILFTLYLIIPGPQLPPPDLPESLKSTELRDTVEIENVSAYFTDKTREEVIDFYQSYFSRSSFLNIPLPIIRLNHPPEYAREVIRGTIEIYYLEELVLPFRQSLFINGFDWEEDVFTPEESRDKNKIDIGGQIWRAKITLRWFPSNLFARTGIFWLSWELFFIVGKELTKEFLITIHRLKDKNEN